MTQDEIIRFAIQCRLVTTGNRDGLYMDALTEFAKLVAAKVINSTWTKEQWTDYEKTIAAKEREAIAWHFESHWKGEYTDVEIAAAIRARGEQA